jgi:hypothetical protein
MQFAPRMSPTISECNLVIGAFEQRVKGFFSAALAFD